MSLTSLWGITFDTEIDLPGRACEGAAAEVTIRRGCVPDSIPEVRADGVAFQAGPGVFRFSIPGMVSFLITNGSEILVDAAEATHPDTVRLLLLGTPMRALLHQRERIPLHAAAIEIDGQAVLISGFSSNGKSAQAAALHDLGHRVVADDVCAVHATASGVMVEPGPTELNLWHDTLKRLGKEPDDFEQVRPELLKYRVPVTTVDAALPVRAMYVLGTHNVDGFDVTEIENLGRIRTILTQTRGSGYLDGLGAKPSHFRTSMAIVQQVTMKRLAWPRGVAGIEAVRDALMEDLA